jgi:hypothetical protein
MIGILDYVLERMPRTYRFNSYPLVKKAYTVMLYVYGLSFRGLPRDIV